MKYLPVLYKFQFLSTVVVTCECIVSLKVAAQLPVAWLWVFWGGFVWVFLFEVEMISTFDTEAGKSCTTMALHLHYFEKNNW